ncbi:MAG: hypothetical protein IT460_02035 [Planctomycetes bacterium]|nr:hypothetical protein [Planctomycetota bacterium]
MGLQQGAAPSLGRGVLVVCGAVPDECLHPGSYFARWAACTPERPEPGWEWLGYDVIDDTFCSAIRGSGEFSVSTRTSMTREYQILRSRLNANFLMPDFTAASDLARFVDVHADGGSSATAPCALLLVSPP